MKTIFLTIGAMVIAVTAITQQPPPRPPRVVTDAQVLAALKDPSLSTDDMINIVGPAAALPPHTLRPATLAAITQKIR